jgi:tetratricopeptide (TPR) repeat protein
MTQSYSSIINGQNFIMAGGEQVPVSVVIAQGRDTKIDTQLTLDPAQLETARSKSSSLRDVLMQLRVAVEVLIDGSLIATVTRQGTATDQAVQAARCALIVRERWPESDVAVVTGRAVLDGTTMFGEVLGRLGLMIEGARERPPLPPGSVYVDEITSRLIENHMAVLKDGSGQYILSSTAQSVDETRMVLGVPTPCVGRERELNLLDATFTSCCEGGAATAVLVSAPPGTGKSRLRHEFLRRLRARERDVTILTGRGDPMSAGASYGLLSQALGHLFGISDGEDLKIRQDKIVARVRKTVPHADVQYVSEFLGELCGVPFPDDIALRAARQDPRVMSDQVMQAFVQFLGAETERHPVLLLLEDLHWGDVLTVKLVDSALRQLSDQPLMVLALARPEVEELFPKLWADRARQDIRLGALPKRACARLVQQVLGDKVSPAVQERLIEQAAGNALFLEELMRAVAAGKGEDLPGTVLAVLRARLMRLVPEARRVLRAASIFGETFWEGGLRRLLGREGTGNQLETWLQILVESEIIERRRESRFPSEPEYSFRHGLVRDAAYSMLTDDDRRVGHYLAGCFLEEAGERYPMVLAEHFRLSGDTPRAIVLYTHAAEQACECNDLEAALQRAKLGLDCGAEGEERAAILSIQAYAWFWRNELEKAMEAGLESIEQLTPGSLRWCKAMGCVTASAAALGRREQVSALALRFGNITPAPEILGAYIEAISLVAVMLGLIGDREMADLFLSYAETFGGPAAPDDPAVRAWLNYAVGRLGAALRPQPYRTLLAFQASATAFHLIGDRRMIAVATGDLGLTLARLGRPREAERKLREILQLAQQLDEPITLTWVQMYLALVLAERGDAEARAEARQLAQSILRTIGERSYYSGIAYCVLAAVERVEDPALAEQHAIRAVEILSATTSSAPLGYIALANVLLSAGRADAAAKEAERGCACAPRSAAAAPPRCRCAWSRSRRCGGSQTPRRWPLPRPSSSASWRCAPPTSRTPRCARATWRGSRAMPARRSSSDTADTGPYPVAGALRAPGAAPPAAGPAPGSRSLDSDSRCRTNGYVCFLVAQYEAICMAYRGRCVCSYVLCDN